MTCASEAAGIGGLAASLEAASNRFILNGALNLATRSTDRRERPRFLPHLLPSGATAPPDPKSRSAFFPGGSSHPDPASISSGSPSPSTEQPIALPHLLPHNGCTVSSCEPRLDPDPQRREAHTTTHRAPASVLPYYLAAKKKFAASFLCGSSHFHAAQPLRLTSSMRGLNFTDVVASRRPTDMNREFTLFIHELEESTRPLSFCCLFFENLFLLSVQWSP
ncbi:uncharacterized protein LOC124663669 [Lolium rigidum]|uniref:uncharacterized protein LOC124663669 n=1 Tax=Lolium rigidum TaxID=89674 RepID=UPI001F5E0644|nr:uncharacterized protein LOC124663669 [Lolium rigidum]